MTMTGAEVNWFSEVSRLEPCNDGCFDAIVSSEWTIGDKPNGGYLLSLLGRAAVTLGVHPHVMAASAHFLHSPDPGPVKIETEVLRTGRSASQLAARLVQQGTTCVEALLTTTTIDAESSPYWDTGVPQPGLLSLEDCPRLVAASPGGVRVAIMEHVEVRLQPSSMGFTTGQPTGRGELRGWLALPGGEPFDPVSLLFAVDAFPPATFDVEFAGWVPTFELTVYVRALPAPGPLRILQRAQLVEGQKLDEACFAWDVRGRLVAQGTQLAGIRLG
ncbi:MAG TPA: thioesterase family protein [Acidimicrobiales bacterium]|nr:thioesterase family protein [Acidimicrobiales bacterium]